MKKFPKTVWAFGWASLFTDVSAEMIYFMIPSFLSVTLGAGAFALGLIEGAAETTAAFSNWFSGLFADRVKRRKPMILLGYGISGFVRPLIGLASSWGAVFAVRVTDRLGKGFRSSPRDLLITNATHPKHRGAAFGLHRAMDHAGNVAGPLIGSFLLYLGMSTRHVFLAAIVPAILVLFILVLGIQEKTGKGSDAGKRRGPAKGQGIAWKLLPDPFKLYLLALWVFALGASTDAFILLRLSNAGISIVKVGFLWSLHNGLKMVSTYYGGFWSDKIGPRRMILAGWAVYAAVYLAFGLATSTWMLVAVFMVYALYFGLSEPAEKSWVAGLVSTRIRGAAFGYANAVEGLAFLPASLLFGWISTAFGAPTAFFTGAGLAGAGTVLLLCVKPARI